VVVVNAMLVPDPLQTVCADGVAITVDTGLTVTSKLNDVPVQEFADGTITYLTTIGLDDVLVRTSEIGLLVWPVTPGSVMFVTVALLQV
jgi:hypothetical protein